MPLKKILALTLLVLVAASVSALSQTQSPKHNLMPVPASLQFQSGRLALTDSFAIAVKGHSDARLTAAIDRMARRLEARTGLTFMRGLSGDEAKAALVIQCQGAGKAIPSVEEDESYTLKVSGSQAVMSAPTVVGALRGLESFLQLLGGDKDGYFIPAVSIQDQPRFPWRGLLIDIGRHWQPMDVLKRNLDGMAAVKLNVLHLHITEDQGFRIESKKFPELHQMGSDGNFYTQDQMREVIEYARMRGIRVVPEFDMPGHTTAWFVSHPELASAPGPYKIERKWGVFDPAMDPTNERLYEILDGFLGEMAALFPDAYLHIGGDESEGKHWNANLKIQAFIKEKGLKDNHGLQAYFNKRLLAILQKNGKRMIGWDEILHPDLPNDIVVHSWRGPKSLADAAKKGYAGILSNGYYIDLMEPASRHYVNDPLPENTTLTPAEQKLILGGEATMWSEWVSPETIDSRIWPRTAAIAERFWSPREVKDVDDMYRRLAVVSVQLEDVGLLHKKNPAAMLRRLVGGDAARNEESIDDLFAKVKQLIDLVEPVKGYRRGSLQKATQFTPLTRLVDIAQSDSGSGRAFAENVERVLYPRSFGMLLYDASELKQWKQLAVSLDQYVFQHLHLPEKTPTPTADGQKSETINIDLQFYNLPKPLLAEAEPLVKDLKEVCEIGLDAFEHFRSAKVPSAEWRDAKLARLAETSKSKLPVELAIVQSVKELVIAAAEREKRKTMSAEDWKKMIKEMAAPKKR